VVVPREFSLEQNYPNPFNPLTKIRFALPTAETVKIDLYNNLGQKIQSILNSQYRAGYHEIDFDGSNLPSGVYFYKMTAGKFSEVKKMILVK
jgi:flagellar hook assembly protein FlgD